MLTWSHVTDWKLNISSSKRFIITKFCRAVTNDERNSPIILHESLTTKSCVVTWQTKNKISSLAQRLSPPKLAGWKLAMRGSHSLCHMTLWLRNHMKSRNKLKADYLVFCKTNGHQTWQSDDLLRGKLIHNDPLITWSFEVLWQIENLISSVPQAPWPPNMAGWELMVKGTHLWSHRILWQRGDVW